MSSLYVALLLGASHHRRSVMLADPRRGASPVARSPPPLIAAHCVKTAERREDKPSAGASYVAGGIGRDVRPDHENGVRCGWARAPNAGAPESPKQFLASKKRAGNAHSMNSTIEAAETNVKAFAYKHCAEPGVPADTPVLEVFEALSGSWRRIQLARPGPRFQMPDPVSVVRVRTVTGGTIVRWNSRRDSYRSRSEPVRGVYPEMKQGRPRLPRQALTPKARQIPTVEEVSLEGRQFRTTAN